MAEPAVASPAALSSGAAAASAAEAVADEKGLHQTAKAQQDVLLARGDTSELLRFALACGLLKDVKRTGWVRNGVPQPETVASHMYRMAMLAFALPALPGVDRDRCIKMSLVHDLAESLVGDITPNSGVSKEEKYRREQEAVELLAKYLSGTNAAAAEELQTLWLEYEAGETADAKVVKDLDKFDMVLQALEYEARYKGPGALGEFFKSVHGKLVTPPVKTLLDEVEDIRRKLESSNQS